MQWGQVARAPAARRCARSPASRRTGAPRCGAGGWSPRPCSSPAAPARLPRRRPARRRCRGRAGFGRPPSSRCGHRRRAVQHAHHRRAQAADHPALDLGDQHQPAFGRHRGQSFANFRWAGPILQLPDQPGEPGGIRGLRRPDQAFSHVLQVPACAPCLAQTPDIFCCNWASTAAPPCLALQSRSLAPHLPTFTRVRW